MLKFIVKLQHVFFVNMGMFFIVFQLWIFGLFLYLAETL